LLSPDEFYQENKPNYLQQGDVLTGVPLIYLPASKELVLVRSHPSRMLIADLQAGTVEAVRELAASDPFDNQPEYVIVSAVRSLAVLMTPTCDLDKDDLLVSPAHYVEGSGYDVGNLKSGKYSTLFWLPLHEHFPECFVDVSDLRPVRCESIDLHNRLASLTREAQNLLLEKFMKGMGRKWGHAKGETIEPLEKNQTGSYRCYRCNDHDITIPQEKFTAGAEYPACPNCDKIGKESQWYPLLKHRKY
jgi:hypothetical protein